MIWLLKIHFKPNYKERLYLFSWRLNFNISKPVSHYMVNIFDFQSIQQSQDKVERRYIKLNVYDWMLIAHVHKIIWYKYLDKSLHLNLIYYWDNHREWLSIHAQQRLRRLNWFDSSWSISHKSVKTDQWSINTDNCRSLTHAASYLLGGVHSPTDKQFCLVLF